MNKQVAFIDEYGDSSLETDKKDVSTHFIVTAVIVDYDKIKEIEAKLSLIRKRYFQLGEMKSKKVGSNDRRRLAIIKEIITTKVHFFSLIIDKRELYSKGLKFKNTFYKFIPGLVYNELIKHFPSLKISSDEFGYKSFMNKFIEYVKKHHVRDLFNQTEFEFIESNSSLLIQTSDFIAGTLARCYDPKKKSTISREFLLQLNKISLGIKQWPTKLGNRLYLEYEGLGEFDKDISTLGLNLALSYINHKENSLELATIDRVRCLEYIMQSFEFAPHKYISTAEIKEYLIRLRNIEMSEHYFRSKVIAKLRDEGIIICSSYKGYKLPSSERDLYDFLNHSTTVIAPMVNRIKKCRDSIKFITKNRLDILNRKEYLDIKKFLDFDTMKLSEMNQKLANERINKNMITTIKN